MFKFRLQFLFITLLTIGAGLLLSQAAGAQTDFGLGVVGDVTGFGSGDLRIIIMSVVRIILGFLGIIAVIMMLYGGWQWMTAAGNADRVQAAKNTLRNAAIGLVIIFSSFMIVSFIIGALEDATGGGSGNQCTPGSVQGCSLIGAPGCAAQQVCTAGGNWGGCIPIDPSNSACVSANQCFVISITPSSPPDRPMNSVVRVRLSQTAITNENAITVTNQSTGGLVAVAATVAGNIVSLVPQQSCAAPWQTYNCFAPNTTFTVTVGTSVQCGGNPVSCGGVGSDPCTNTFTTGDFVDTQTPTVSLIDTQICQGVNPLKALVDDDYGLSQVVFTDGANTQIGIDSFISVPPSEIAQVSWNTANYGINQSVTVTATASDYDSNVISDSRDYVIRAGHCCNGITDSDEVGVDCGGSACEACVPTIEYFLPDDGATGNLTTITGRHFGATVGEVDFANAVGEPVIAAQLADTVNAACTAVWTDKQIIAVVPGTAQDGPIQVTDAAGQFDRTDDSRGVVNDFDVNTTVRPGICGIAPTSGLINSSITAIEGVRFVQGQSSVYFSAVLAGGNPTVAGGTTITNVRVPSVQSGQAGVRVLDQASGEYSNPIGFNVSPAPTTGLFACSTDPLTCNPDSSQCDAGSFCNTSCQCESDGTTPGVISCNNPNEPADSNFPSCHPDNTYCPTGYSCDPSQSCTCQPNTGLPDQSTYTWFFTTTKYGPQALELCNRSTQCSLNTNAYSSPTPFSRTGTNQAGFVVSGARPDDGAVPRDSIVAMTFTEPMNVTTLQQNGSIRVLDCGVSSASFSTANCGATPVSGTLSVDDTTCFYNGQLTTCFNFVPTNSLAAGHWYMVDVNTDQVFAATGAELPGNDPATGNYRWVFETSNQLGSNGCVQTNPSRADLYAQGGTQDYRAEIFDANNACVSLNPNVCTWNWTLNGDTRAEILELYPTPPPNFAIVAAVAETTPADPVNVFAQCTFGGQTNQDDGELFIEFGVPTVVTKWPDCGDACINGQFGAAFSRPMDNAGFVDVNGNVKGTVLLFACYDDATCTPVQGNPGNADRVLPLQADSNPQTVNGYANAYLFDPPCFGNYCLLPGTYYRAILISANEYPIQGIRSAEGKPLGKLNYDYNNNGTNDAYSWVFKTKTDFNMCEYDHVDVLPNPNQMQVGEIDTMSAHPKGAANQCLSQPLIASSFTWNWQSTAPAVANLITPLRNGCGNGFVDRGEDCDDRNLINGDGCSDICLHEGGYLIGVNGGYVSYAPVSRSGSLEWRGDQGIYTNGTQLPVAMGSNVSNIFILTGTDQNQPVLGIIHNLQSPTNAAGAVDFTIEYFGNANPTLLAKDDLPEVFDATGGKWNWTTGADGMMVGLNANQDWTVKVTPKNWNPANIAWRLIANGSPALSASPLQNNQAIFIVKSGNNYYFRQGGLASPPSICGNGILETFEECESVNSVWPAYCDQNSCLVTGSTAKGSISICGNGLVEALEECDTGTEPNGRTTDGCSDVCTLSGSVPGRSLCGDGQVGLGEECDTGELLTGGTPASGDGCSATCLVENDPDVGNTNYGLASCGNGALEAGEACDDGNVSNGDGCSSSCVHEGSQGDGRSRQLVQALSNGQTYIQSWAQSQPADVGQALVTVGDSQDYPVVTKYWPNCSDSCINAQIGVEFSTWMIFKNTVANSAAYPFNYQLLSCGADPTCSGALVPISLEPFSFKYVVLNGRSEVTFNSQSALLPNTYYRVVVNGRVASVKNVALQQLNYDDPLVNGTGALDSFSWIFKTNNNPNACAVDSIGLVPQDKQVFQSQNKLYQSLAFSDPAICSGQRLNAYNYDWTWGIVNQAQTTYPPLNATPPPLYSVCSGSVIADLVDRNNTLFCAVGSVGLVDGNNDGKIDPFQQVRGMSLGTTNVYAYTPNNSNQATTTPVTVVSGGATDFDIVEFFPTNNTTDWCRNVLAAVTFTKELDQTTVDPTLFTLTRTSGANTNVITDLQYATVLGTCETTSNQCLWPSITGGAPVLAGSCSTTNDCVGSRVSVVKVLGDYLDQNTQYTFTVDGAVSSIPLADGTPHFIGTAQSSTFSTNASFCDCDYVSVVTNNSSAGKPTVRDAFTCAGNACGSATDTILDDDISPLNICNSGTRNGLVCSTSADCPGGAAGSCVSAGGLNGNQHQYMATCYDTTNPQAISIPVGLATTYLWTETSAGQLLQLGDFAGGSVGGGSFPDIYVWSTQGANGEGKNGRATVTVVATAQHPGQGVNKVVRRDIAVTNFMCDNPWPAVPNFPYIDNDDNLVDPDMNFELFYCRDQGAAGVDTDDLPALSSPAVFRATTTASLKEFLFSVPSGAGSQADAIGIRVLKNPLHLSPDTWYRSGLCQGVASITHLCFSDAECQGNDNSLLGYWPMSEGVGSTTNSEGRISGATTLRGNAGFAPGNVGTAVSFDGNRDYIEVPVSSEYTISDDLTLAAWIKLDQVDPDGETILDLFGSYALRINNEGPAKGSPKFILNNTGTLDATASLMDVDKWYYVAATYDRRPGSGTSVGKIYLNGQEVLSATGGSIPDQINPPAANQKIVIGASSGPVPPYGIYDFDGTIDEVRVYNRALGPEEILGLYQQTVTGGSCRFNVPERGSPQSIVVDGYQAVRDGRSVYVGATNLTNGQLYSNIYLLSYSQGASSQTQAIVNRILDPSQQAGSWYFNTGMSNLRVCAQDGYFEGTTTLCNLSSGLGASNCGSNTSKSACENSPATEGCGWVEPAGVCVRKACQPISCSNDFQCPNFDCLAEKDKLVRDAERYGELRSVEISLRRRTLPQLSAGSYIPATTFSIWPSWQQTFGAALGGNLPTDPINKVYQCAVNYYCDVNDNNVADSAEMAVGNRCDASYDAVKCPNHACVPDDPDQAATCWDETVKQFFCPMPSADNIPLYSYAYYFTQGDYRLFTNFEFSNGATWATAAKLNDPDTFYQLPYSFLKPPVTECRPFNFEIHSATFGSSGVIGGCGAGNDTDGDGVCNVSDNCVTVPNPNQADSGGAPGVGDACDVNCSGDVDRDGVCDAVDNCLSVYNPIGASCAAYSGIGASGQCDGDGDGIGDACDPCSDRDADGWWDIDTGANDTNVCNKDNVPPELEGDLTSDRFGYCRDANGQVLVNSACRIGGGVYGPAANTRPLCSSCNGVDLATIDPLLSTFNPLQEDFDNDLIGYIADRCIDFDNDGFGDYPFFTQSADPNSVFASVPGITPAVRWVDFLPFQQHFSGCQAGGFTGWTPTP